MYKIGEFSKIVELPVRTIRYYDECGILIPEEVDMFTGYRYYTDSNVEKCEKIKNLKSLDFTLEEIGKCDAEVTEELLISKIKEMERKITLCKLKREKLNAMLYQKHNSVENCNKGKVLKKNYERSYEKCA